MTRPLWEIQNDMTRLRVERKALLKARPFGGPSKSRTYKPEAKGQRDPRELDTAFVSWLHVDTDCIACMIEGRPANRGAIEAAHQKQAIAAKGWREGGLGPRIHDYRCVPLCAHHHRRAPNSCDTGGQRKFWDRLGLGDGIADFCAALYAAFKADEPAMPVIRQFAAGPRSSPNKRAGE